MSVLLEPGTRVGRYQVIAPLGRGGMGGVFEVADDAGRRYALKAPISDGASGGAVTKRFAREANALQRLDHPNLVGAIDVFVEAGLLFLVMEKVEGRTLADMVDSDVHAESAARDPDANAARSEPRALRPRR